MAYSYQVALQSLAQFYFKRSENHSGVTPEWMKRLQIARRRNGGEQSETENYGFYP